MRSEIEQQQSLEATLREVMHLLERQAFVKQVVARSDTRKPELAQSLVARQHAVELEKKLNRMHPADAAFVLESLNQEQRVAAWHLIHRDRRGSILLELAGPVRTSLVTLLDEHELVTLGRQMDADDFADLVQDLPPEHVEQVLAQLGTEQSAEVQIGAVVPGGQRRLADAPRRRDRPRRRHARGRNLFAAPRRHLPQQFTSLSSWIATTCCAACCRSTGSSLATTARVSDVDGQGADVLLDDGSGRRCSRAFERYDLISAPVVNLHRQVVGSLTVDDVLDHVTQDTFKQSLCQVGLSEDEDLFAPIWQSGRKRWAWLGLNLFTAFIASRVVGAFEGSIAQLAALAALMPIVASIGGNTGNQTVALVIRGLALSQLNRGNLRFLLRKELAIGVMNGVLLGLLMGFATLCSTDRGRSRA